MSQTTKKQSYEKYLKRVSNMSQICLTMVHRNFRKCLRTKSRMSKKFQTSLETKLNIKCRTTRKLCLKKFQTKGSMPRKCQISFVAGETSDVSKKSKGVSNSFERSFKCVPQQNPKWFRNCFTNVSKHVSKQHALKRIKILSTPVKQVPNE